MTGVAAAATPTARRYQAWDIDIVQSSPFRTVRQAGARGAWVARARGAVDAEQGSDVDAGAEQR
jgi:hypothetical protein